uniref:Acyl-coenzyme A thioesterase THEM4 n=1 Tax=Alexandrium monilatum TaxID=311494 RepID=A0A7S4V6Y7_9DINO
MAQAASVWTIWMITLFPHVLGRMAAHPAHHVRMARWVEADSFIRLLDADPSLCCLKDSTIQYVAPGAQPSVSGHGTLGAHVATPGTIHGAIGKMLAWNYRRREAEETISAVRFLWGAQGPPNKAHGGQVTSLLDHCFGHCIRGVLGVGPQFTVRLRTELRKPVPLQATLCCQVRIVRREVQPGREGKDGRMRVHLEASIHKTEPPGNLGETLVTGECTFVAFTDAAGKLSKHTPPDSQRLARQRELDEEAHRANPIVYDDVGRILAPGPPMPYFSCRGGAARYWEPTRRWVEGSPEVARLLAEPGWVEMDVDFVRRRLPPDGARWVPSELPGAALEALKAQGDLPPSVSVLGNRVMECYFADTSRPRVIGALKFGRAAAGPPGRVHGGVVATALDEAFVWAGAHVGGGPTAWLDVSLRGASPLETTLFVLVELEKAEVAKSKRFKVYLRARIYQPKPEALAEVGRPIDEAVSSCPLLTEATTLLIGTWLDPRWESYIVASGASEARL